MDITHYYTETGAGEPLILLHGNNEDSSYFMNQISAFSERYRVIAVDTRGHGKTPRGSAPFTIRQFAEDLAEFMNVINTESAHILGFSDGANIAMCFASKYPLRVRRLILNGGNLNASGVRMRTQLPVEIGCRVLKAAAAALGSTKLTRSAEMLGLMVNQPDISIEELGKITAETLVIAGTSDLIKKEHSEFIASNIKNARLQFIRGSHFVAAENPDEFNRAVLEFLHLSCPLTV